MTRNPGAIFTVDGDHEMEITGTGGLFDSMLLQHFAKVLWKQCSNLLQVAAASQLEPHYQAQLPILAHFQITQSQVCNLPQGNMVLGYLAQRNCCRSHRPQ